MVLNIQERVYGWTPLFLAAVEGYEECVRVLLAAGAQPASKDLDGWTPHEHGMQRCFGFSMGHYFDTARL